MAVAFETNKRFLHVETLVRSALLTYGNGTTYLLYQISVGGGGCFLPFSQ